MKRKTLVELNDDEFAKFLESLSQKELEKIEEQNNDDILFDTVAQATRRIKIKETKKSE